jgi:hypothetical protein
MYQGVAPIVSLTCHGSVEEAGCASRRELIISEFESSLLSIQTLGKTQGSKAARKTPALDVRGRRAIIVESHGC